MSTIGSDTVVGVLPKGADVVIQTDLDGNDLVVANDTVKKAEYDVTGDISFSGSSTSKSDVNVETKKGETITVSVKSTFKKTDIKNEGKGQLEVNVVGSSFKKGKIIGGNKADNVSFDGSSIIIKSKVDLGKGNDSITFNDGVKLKGKTKVDLGKKGTDTVVIENLSKLGGQIVIKNFDKNDTITVDGKVYDYSDRKALNALDGIKIKG